MTSEILLLSRNSRFHIGKSRFTDSLLMAVLKRAEAGVKVPGLCREHGISSATFYKWRSKSGGMETSMVKRVEFEMGPRLPRENGKAASPL